MGTKGMSFSVRFAAFDDLDGCLSLECGIGSPHPLAEFVGGHQFCHGRSQVFRFHDLFVAPITTVPPGGLGELESHFPLLVLHQPRQALG
jgi:hypothetical protein